MTMILPLFHFVIADQRPTLIVTVEYEGVKERLLTETRDLGIKPLVIEVRRDLGDDPIPAGVARVIGSSSSPKILQLVQSFVDRDKNVMVICPNDHAPFYAEFVSPGGYLVTLGRTPGYTFVGFEANEEKEWYRKSLVK